MPSHVMFSWASLVSDMTPVFFRGWGGRGGDVPIVGRSKTGFFGRSMSMFSMFVFFLSIYCKIECSSMSLLSILIYSI